MGLLLSLDVGEKRVGTALADESSTVATPHQTFLRANGAAERAIIELVTARNISRLVVGMPFNQDGSRNAQCDKVEQFCRRLERRLNIEIVFVDEYLSSSAALESIAPRRRRDARALRESGEIDSRAAALLLQEYLEHLNRSRPD